MQVRLITPTCSRQSPQTLWWGLSSTSFGLALVVGSIEGIVYLAFRRPGEADAVAAQHSIRSLWPQADFMRDDDGASKLLRPIFDLHITAQDLVTVAVQGTSFQHDVWQILLSIPRGSVMTYSEVAGALGKPKAARAVGGACATNPVALFIPCHRVVPQSGGTGRYRWGESVKRQLLSHERNLERHDSSEVSRFPPSPSVKDS